MKKKPVLFLAYAGMLSALTFVATAFLKLPLSITQGYVHLGDGLVLFGALLLGPVAIPAAAVGSMLADLFGGYVVYCVPTLIIKGLMAGLAALNFHGEYAKGYSIFVMIVAVEIMVGGYFFVEYFILNLGMATAIAGLIPNLVQGAIGIAIALLAAPCKQRIRKALKL